MIDFADTEGVLPPKRRSVAATPRSGEARVWEKSFLILLAAVALCVFEGAARKWLIDSEKGVLSYLAYFSKDIALALLLLLPRRGRDGEILEDFYRWLVPGCALVVAGALVSSIKGYNPVGAALTLRALIILPVLAGLAARRFGTRHLDAVAFALAVFTILNFGLGLVQTRLPPHHFLNRYASDTRDIVEVKAGVRACGTFSYITGMSIMSVGGVWAGLILLGISEQSWGRALGIASIVAGFGCALVSFSRGPVVVAALMIIAWLLQSRAGLTILLRAASVGLIMTFLAWCLGTFPIFSELGMGLWERNETADDTMDNRIFGQIQEAEEAVSVAPLGNGLGFEQVAASYYSQGERSFTTFETQFPRLILDTGVFGFAGFLLIYGGAAWALQRAKSLTLLKGDHAILLATQLFLGAIAYTNVVYNHTASSMMWIVVAVVLGAAYAPGRGGVCEINES